MQFVVLKSSHEIERIRRAAQAARRVAHRMRAVTHAGMTTQELDTLAGDTMRREGAVSACRNYPTGREGEGFGGFTCISVNDEVLHGLPGTRLLSDGDIVKLEVPVCVDGFYGSYAETVQLGAVTAEAQRLIDVTAQALALAVGLAQPRKKWSEIAREIQWFVESNGFNVVREFVGHGIGQRMHEEPQVPNYGEPGRGPRLAEGMVLAIEPMVNAGKPAVKVLADGWTAVTRDSSLSAHFEHTVAVRADGPWILTAREVPVHARK
jgi:methionyl aminopeptidase